MRELSDLTVIRVIITGAPNFGHQNAGISTMRKLRTLGFKGTFDIRYKEPEALQEILRFGMPIPMLTGDKLTILIGNYRPQPLFTVDTGTAMQNDELGSIQITRLEDLNAKESYQLPQVELTICAAEDNVNVAKSKYLFQVYSTDNYIQLQPTDFPGPRFVTAKSFLRNSMIQISENARLADDKKPHFPAKLSVVEEKIINICASKNYNTQLVYGMHDNYACLDPFVEFQRLTMAHRRRVNTDKPTILFFPKNQKMFYTLEEKNCDTNIHFVNLTDSSIESIESQNYQKTDIICVFTDKICPAVFHQLMESLTYPPVIEG